MSTVRDADEGRAPLLSVATAAPLVLFEIACDGMILTSVGSGRRSLRRQSVVGDSLYDLYADVPAVTRAFERALEGESFTAVTRVPGRDGEVVFETTYVPVLGRGGRVESVRGVAIDVTRRVRAEEARAEAAGDLRALAAELQALADRVQTEREAERQRVAWDVHDVLGQVLTAVRFETGWLRRRLAGEAPLDRPALLSRLADADGLVDEAVRTVQELASGLRPPAFEHVGLTGALTGELARFEARTGVRAVLASDLAPSVEAGLSGACLLALFRIGQEALTNVARHAGASTVTVWAGVDGERVTLAVEDDGRGMPADGGRPGALGLVGARERAAALGGTLRVASEPGRGTRVEASLPLACGEPLSSRRSVPTGRPR